MNDLRCQDVDEMLAGYAADALEPDDQRDVALHLAECRNHDESLQALRQTYGGLAAAIAPIEPPAALRSSLLDAFDREIAGPSRSVDTATARSISPGTRLTPAGWFGYALAAALLVVAVGLGAWAVSRGDDGSDVQVITTMDASGSLQLTYFPEQGLGVIDVSLPSLGDDRAYQAWRLDDAGNAVSLGVLPSTAGRFALDGDLRGAAVVALSVEPAGGSPQPTSDPILVTSLN